MSLDSEDSASRIQGLIRLIATVTAVLNAAQLTLNNHLKQDVIVNDTAPCLNPPTL